MLLSREAFDLVQAGRLDEAVAKYAEATQVLDPDHYWSPNNHGEYASVLSRLGRNDEALQHYEIALEQEQRLYPRDETAAPIVMARYFLGDHLVRIGLFARALEILAPALGKGCRQEALVRSIEAAALFALGRVDEARNAARLALQLAASEKQREGLRERLGDVLDG
jgi:tetratricopeptide (TPR) repeat protein